MIARCFLALELGETGRRAVADATRLLDADRFRKSTPASWHVTVKFLGQVDIETVGRPVFAAVAPLVANSPPFELGVGALAGFPSEARARVVVLACDGAGGGVSALAVRADEAAAALGVPREDRAFRPHVTLARSKVDVDVRALARRFSPRPLGVAGRLVLFESARGAYAALDAVASG